MSLHEKIENWKEDEEVHSWEGSRGLTNLDKLLSHLGYSDNGCRQGSAVENFLQDNSGAIEALVEWIADQNLPEWNENLADFEDEEEY